MSAGHGLLHKILQTPLANLQAQAPRTCSKASMASEQTLKLGKMPETMQE